MSPSGAPALYRCRASQAKQRVCYHMPLLSNLNACLLRSSHCLVQVPISIYIYMYQMPQPSSGGKQGSGWFPRIPLRLCLTRADSVVARRRSLSHLTLPSLSLFSFTFHSRLQDDRRDRVNFLINSSFPRTAPLGFQHTRLQSTAHVSACCCAGLLRMQELLHPSLPSFPSPRRLPYLILPDGWAPSD